MKTKGGSLLAAGLVWMAAMSSQAAQNAPATSTCDRDCLEGIVDSCVAAMVALDPKKVAPAADFPLHNVPGIQTRTINLNPFDMPASHLCKVWGGKIPEIEAIGVSIPYNSPTGWDPQ